MSFQQLSEVYSARTTSATVNDYISFTRRFHKLPSVIITCEKCTCILFLNDYETSSLHHSTLRCLRQEDML